MSTTQLSAVTLSLISWEHPPTVTGQISSTSNIIMCKSHFSKVICQRCADSLQTGWVEKRCKDARLRNVTALDCPLRYHTKEVYTDFLCGPCARGLFRKEAWLLIGGELMLMGRAAAFVVLLRQATVFGYYYLNKRRDLTITLRAIGRLSVII